MNLRKNLDTTMLVATKTEMAYKHFWFFNKKKIPINKKENAIKDRNTSNEKKK